MFSRESGSLGFRHAARSASAALWSFEAAWWTRNRPVLVPAPLAGIDTTIASVRIDAVLGFR
jgi:hypothetical protein